MNSMLATAQATIRQAAAQLGYDKTVVDGFLRPEHVHSFEVSAGGKTYPAYRVQHNSKLGPYKGGIRFHPSVSLDEVQALATLMSLKTAAAGLPLGGGKGGVAVDPKTLSPAELQELATDYGRKLAPFIGSDTDIPGPDVGVTPALIDCMLDGYEQVIGHADPGAFTGKSMSRGGSEGREAATGRGGVVVLMEYLKAHSLYGKSFTIALQGLGNVGYFFARILHDEYPRATIVALANTRNTWHNLEGIDVTKAGAQSGYPRPEDLVDIAKAQILPNSAIISASVDILVLAALEDAITEANVTTVQARTVVELANGPVNETAERQLQARKVAILPDFIANAGGVIVSCLEWQQNLAHQHWPEDKVNAQLTKVMQNAAQAALARAQARSVSFKQAATELALISLLGK